METDPALLAYEAFASVYNEFTHENDYEMWLGQVLLPELRRHGLRGPGKALDVGCGTGRAFQPLLRRGWEVHGCDISPAMVDRAAEEGGGAVTLQVADMRELPDLGDFDLVLSLNDAVNYLLGDDDLTLALSKMRANLAEGGLLIFDVNSSSTFTDGFTGTREVEHEGSRWVWTGRGEVEPSIFEVEIAGDRLEPIRGLERFRSEQEVLESLEAAGLRTLGVYGMSEENGVVQLSQPVDENRDYKLVFIAAADSRPA